MFSKLFTANLLNSLKERKNYVLYLNKYKFDHVFDFLSNFINQLLIKNSYTLEYAYIFPCFLI